MRNLKTFESFLINESKKKPSKSEILYIKFCF